MQAVFGVEDGLSVRGRVDQVEQHHHQRDVAQHGVAQHVGQPFFDVGQDRSRLPLLDRRHVEAHADRNQRRARHQVGGGVDDVERGDGDDADDRACDGRPQHLRGLVAGVDAPVGGDQVGAAHQAWDGGELGLLEDQGQRRGGEVDDVGSVEERARVIDQEIKDGVFDYLSWFPGGNLAGRFLPERDLTVRHYEVSDTG